VLGDFRTSEQRIPASGMQGRALEVNMTINGSWATARTTKNGNRRSSSSATCPTSPARTQLSPECRADRRGRDSQPEIDRLLAIGRWLKVNGEAIYATRGNDFRRRCVGPTTQKAHSDRRGDALPFTSGNGPPMGKSSAGIKQAARSGRFAVGGAKVTSTVTAEGLVVTLPGSAPDPDVSVVALDFDRPVEVVGAAPLPTDTGASGTLADRASRRGVQVDPWSNFQKQL